ncbi:hypothetical protein [Arachidicoccus soli]|uniref:CCDC81-like prokaryotic HU domain-containing protein n=1 Tax=Arachidicoccus soli TaxID=2341117 RepID=A0A386HTT5_9BACT|nr:hypothetical protein [Arachidicoccus soli]AYD48911.1 hypothetical protein D6B99_15615 [Arachidicoccus soli]
MKALLHYFLVQNKKISIPQVGSISIVNRDAEDDFGEKTIVPPTYSFLYKKENDAIAENAFMQFATQKLQVTESIVKDFLDRLAEEFSTSKRLDIDGVGVITDEKDNLNFQPHSSWRCYSPILVNRVIHADAKHVVRVGEDEKTSTEMQELLSKEKQKKYWWAYVLVILLFLAGCGYMYYYYFYQK